MQFTSFPRSLFALTILLSSAPLPTIAIPTGHPSAPATVDDTASANFVSVNDPAAILALLQAADVKYNRASRSGLNGDESEKVYVSHRVVIDEDYLERSNAPDHVKQQYRNDMSSSGTESLQRRQWGNTYIQCETTGGSPEALHVHFASDEIALYRGETWITSGGCCQPDDYCGRSIHLPMHEWHCSEFFPNQWSRGIGIFGTAATGTCAKYELTRKCADVGWYIQQIAHSCVWNGLAGGYIHYQMSDATYHHFMAFHS